MTGNTDAPKTPEQDVSAGQHVGRSPSRARATFPPHRILIFGQVALTLWFAIGTVVSPWPAAWCLASWIWTAAWLVTRGDAVMWHELYTDLQQWHNLVMPRPWEKR